MSRGTPRPNRKGQKLRPEDNEFAVARERFVAQQLPADLQEAPEEVKADQDSEWIAEPTTAPKSNKKRKARR